MGEFDINRCADVVLRAGGLMLGSGTSALRVKEVMREVSGALGVETMQAQITYTDITVTVSHEGIYRTQVLEVPFPTVNSDRIASLLHLVHTLPALTTPEDIDQRLDAIQARRPRFARWLVMLLVGLACSAVTLLNGGDWRDVVAVAPASAFAWWLHVQLTSRQVNRLACVLVSSVAASAGFLLVTQLFALTQPTNDPRLAVGLICAAIFLVPGFPLVTGGLDLTRLDFNAGIPRVVYAAMVLLTIAIGVWLVVGLAGETPDAGPPWVLPVGLLWGVRLLASFVCVIGWAMAFNSPPRAVLAAGLIAMVGNTPRLILIDHGIANHIATFIGAVIMGLLCAVAAKVLNAEKVIMTVPTLLVMIPGAPALRTMLYFDAGETTRALEFLFTTVLVVIAMVAGLSAARMLTDPEWAFTRAEPPSLHEAALGVTRRVATTATSRMLRPFRRR